MSSFLCGKNRHTGHYGIKYDIIIINLDGLIGRISTVVAHIKILI